MPSCSTRCSRPAAPGRAIAHVKANARPTTISFVCIVAAPEGVARMEADHPEVPIVAGRSIAS